MRSAVQPSISARRGDHPRALAILWRFGSSPARSSHQSSAARRRSTAIGALDHVAAVLAADIAPAAEEGGGHAVGRAGVQAWIAASSSIAAWSLRAGVTSPAGSWALRA